MSSQEMANHPTAEGWTNGYSDGLGGTQPDPLWLGDRDYMEGYHYGRGDRLAQVEGARRRARHRVGRHPRGWESIG